jgi:hypothetical protein
VHDGTGIYGPKARPYTALTPGKYMVFGVWKKARKRRKSYRFLEIKGQEPNPYLDNAFLIIDGTYVPIRIELLRAQIAAET